MNWKFWVRCLHYPNLSSFLYSYSSDILNCSTLSRKLSKQLLMVGFSTKTSVLFSSLLFSLDCVSVSGSSTWFSWSSVLLRSGNDSLVTLVSSSMGCKIRGGCIDTVVLTTVVAGATDTFDEDALPNQMSSSWIQLSSSSLLISVKSSVNSSSSNDLFLKRRCNLKIL